MFGELPKLFDRNFVTSFVLPATSFILLLLWLLLKFGISIPVSFTTAIDPLTGTTVAAISGWISGVILSVFNREIIRFFEGYGFFNPLRLLWFTQFLRFSYLYYIQEKLLDKIDENRITPRQERKLADISIILTEEFPQNRDKLLPTRFGNTVKSFEDYPRIIYGFESINGWDRLQAVIPEQYLELINNAKAQTDFWINTKFLVLLLSCLYIVLAIMNQQIPVVWILPILFFAYIVAENRSVSAAIEWGEMVKSSFDVFLPDLREKLGYKEFESHDETRNFWIKFSQVMVYRRPDVMESLYKLKSSKPSKTSHYNRIMRAKTKGR